MTDRVLIAMSGGVDSSVAAARLRDQGYDAVGITLHLWDYPDPGASRTRCCAPEDIHTARRVCDALGIPHYAFDRRELFEREVVAPFVEGYLAGTTPSPCVACNRGIKLPELLGLADRLGARLVATGHYARIDTTWPIPRLLRAADLTKDQSYFLHTLGAPALTRLMFPLGQATKREVREEALRRGLPGADKPESQELCFVSAGHYAEFVTARAADRVRPGNILDESGRTLGTHPGVHHFTLGQRRGLGVHTGQRSFVTGLDPEQGIVQLGSREALQCFSAIVEDVCLAEGVTLPLECDVVVRYRGEPQPARVRTHTEGAELTFTTPAMAVVPGQYAVFYSGDRVLGGAKILRTERAVTDAARVH